MQIDDRYIPIEEWEAWDSPLLNKSWGEFEQFNANIPKGEPTVGYRIMYRASDGNLYGAFHPGAAKLEELIRQKQDISIYRNTPGTIHEDISNNGYYYWTDRQAAEAYMAKLLTKTRGIESYEMYQVEGTSAGVGGREGDRMNNMYMYPEPVIRIKS